jgi:hypothetical protein
MPFDDFIYVDEPASTGATTFGTSTGATSSMGGDDGYTDDQFTYGPSTTGATAFGASTGATSSMGGDDGYTDDQYTYTSTTGIM